MPTVDEEIRRLRDAVGRHFSVYGVIVTPLALTFQVREPSGSVDEGFDELRRELMPNGYVPSITRERGELVVHVQRRPPQRFTTVRTNVVMLAITVVTTVFFGGAWNWSTYTGVPLLSADSLLYGTIFFTIPLLAILGFHEMGHYVVAKRYRVQASLPFFLPSVPPLGTFGAFISMRDPLPNRRALLDIGASGPLVGFAIAIPVTLLGLFLTGSSPHPLLPVEGEFQLIQPSLFYGFLGLFFPISRNVALHPLAFAGWVGLFVTAINLLPAGQLDGGHIARALLGNRQHYISWAAIFLLFVMSTFYLGWLIFGFLILMLGVRHPPPLNDLSPLKPGRTLVGVAAVVILLATFIPQPFAFSPVAHGIQFEDAAGHPLTLINQTAAPSTGITISFYLNETTPSPENVNLTIDPKNLNLANFSLTFQQIHVPNGTASIQGLQAVIHFNESQRALIDISVTVPANAGGSRPWAFAVDALVPSTGDSRTLSLIVFVM